MTRMGRSMCEALWVAGVICAAVVARAEADGTASPERLVFRGSHVIFAHADGLREPSGLALDQATGTFLTVSDDSRHVFVLDAEGGIIERLPAVDDLEDVEGIDAATERLILLLSEELGGIVSMDRAAPDKATMHLLSEMPGFDAFLAVADDDRKRLSPEGLAVNGATAALLVANERDPRALIEVSPRLDRIVGVTLLSEERGFVCRHASDDVLDVSGLAYDARRDGIWIASDTGKCVFFWDGSETPARHFELAWLDGERVRTVNNAEGVAVSPDGETLFVVTDDGKASRLFRYTIE
jgi:uncharacterized protein YjiK